jgi:hypothetical protein
VAGPAGGAGETVVSFGHGEGVAEAEAKGNRALHTTRCRGPNTKAPQHVAVG